MRERLIVTGTDFDRIDFIKDSSVDELLGTIEDFFLGQEDPVKAEIAMIA